MSTSPTVPGREGLPGPPGAEGEDRSVLTDRGLTERETGDRAYRRALWSLLLFVGSLLLSVVVFAVVWNAAGWTTVWASSYPAGRHSPFGWQARGAWVLLTLLYVWPEIVVVLFARKARHHGRPGWPLPVILGGVLAALLPVLNLALLVG